MPKAMRSRRSAAWNADGGAMEDGNKEKAPLATLDSDGGVFFN